MAYPNPHYDPDWRTAHHYHHGEAMRLQGEMQRLVAGGGEPGDAYWAAKAESNRHHAASLKAFKRQHATVQEYAVWVFASFPVGMAGESLPLPEVDFEELTTVEEVDAAWARLNRIATEAASERRSGLPVGQPPELDAFADPAAPGLIRAWREFSPRELYPTGSAPGRNVRTLVTVDERADGWHICFMQDWGTPGPSVTNTIERLATAVYREACAIAEQQAGRAGGVRGLVGRVSSRLGLAQQPDPARFQFYEHTPPRGDGLLRESFCRVVLRFEGGQYRQPEWRRYQVVPALIQSARYDCAREASQGKGQTLLPKQN